MVAQDNSRRGLGGVLLNTEEAGIRFLRGVVLGKKHYEESSRYLEGGVGTTRASRWIGPFSFRITRSARLRMTVDSVRYTTYKASHVPRHCKWGPVCYFYFAFGGLTFRGLSPPI